MTSKTEILFWVYVNLASGILIRTSQVLAEAAGRAALAAGDSQETIPEQHGSVRASSSSSSRSVSPGHQGSAAPRNEPSTSHPRTALPAL